MMRAIVLTLSFACLGSPTPPPVSVPRRHKRIDDDVNDDVDARERVDALGTERCIGTRSGWCGRGKRLMIYTTNIYIHQTPLGIGDPL